MSKPREPGTPGVTPRSVAAMAFCILLIGVMIQFGQVVEGKFSDAAEYALSIAGVIVILGLLAVSGGLYVLTRRRLLTRPELLCIYFAMMVATPIIGQGFWHRFLSIVGTLPRTADFARIDALSDRLWPHGANLLEGCWTSPDNSRVTVRGRIEWREIEFEEGKTGRVPAIANRAPEEISAVRLSVPVLSDGKDGVLLDEPYLISVLARPASMGPKATMFCRIYHDDGETFVKQAFTSRESERQVTFLHKNGFHRLGAYGVVFDGAPRERIDIEFGLSGEGEVVFADPKLMSVLALERAYTARRAISREDYEALPECRRAGYVVRPERWLSWAGLKFVLSGYVPWRQWVGPLAAWGALLLLILTALFCVAVIMRRQWVDNERYPLPLMRVSQAILGEKGESDEAVPPLYKNRLMWIGFGVGLFWCLMRAWRLYNPNVPDMAISVDLKPYFSDPSWGRMWENVTFEVNAIFVSLAVFVELNVLISIVIGYFVYRAEFWMARATGLDVYPSFPYPQEQQVGTYLAYGLIVLILSRRHLWQTLKGALRGRGEEDAGEPLSYREAYSALILCGVGAFVWAGWVGVKAPGFLLFFGFVVLCGFVVAKLRAECGAPHSGYMPGRALVFVSLAGGMSVFGAQGVALCTMISFNIVVASLLLIPGMQIEFMQMGRQYGMRPRHVVYASFLGIALGFGVGGWVFLSNAYALGGDNMEQQWYLGEKSWVFNQYNRFLSQATSEMNGGSGAMEQGWTDPARLTVGVTGAVTALVTLMRQWFAGFWFHPIGVVTSTTWFAYKLWGSLLVAWAIRLIVLRLGGAATVRTRLQPFFLGVFLSGVTAYLLLFLFNGYLFFFMPGEERFGLFF